MPLHDIYTLKEAAVYLGVSIHDVRKHVYQLRDLTPNARMGNVRVFTKDVLDDFARTWSRRKRQHHNKETDR